jgi:cysteine synthase
MNKLQPDILHCIGNTSQVALRNVVPGNGARILLKLENENPTGSMKDRMALAMIEAAEADGRLAAGGSVVEYTAGSTGVSLSLVCAVKGYPLYHQFSRAARQAAIRLTGSEQALSYRSGRRVSPIRSNRSPRKKRWP